MKPVIVAKGLSRSFGQKMAIENLNFEVYPGRVVGFLGLNGAGKTTTISILSGRLLPSSGQVSVLGLNPATQEKELARSISVISDELGLYRDMSVRKNLLFFSALYDLPPARVDELISLMELEEHAEKPIKKLSKGLTQRARLAKCLLPDPELLFLDEPTTGIDVDIAREIHDIIRSLRERGKTIFLTTHNMHEVEELCDDIFILKNGRIVYADSLENLRRKNPVKEVEVELESGWQVVAQSELSRFLDNHPDVLTLRSKSVSIEQLFLDLVGEHATEGV